MTADNPTGKQLKPFKCKIGLHRYYIVNYGPVTEKITCRSCGKTRIVPLGWPPQI